MAHVAKPWYRKGRGWYLQLNGMQIKLADGREEAFDRYHQLMTGRYPTGTQVSEILSDPDRATPHSDAVMRKPALRAEGRR